MTRTRLARARLPLRMLGAILGVLLFIHLIHRAGAAKLLASMIALGWGLALVVAWGGVAHIIKTWAWRLALLDGRYQVSFARMLGLRLSSEAVGQFGGLAQLFGEGLRVSLLGPTIPLSQSIASVTIDRAFFVVSAAVVSLLGLCAVLVVLPLPHKLIFYAIVFACLLLTFVLLSAMAIRNRWPLLSRTGEVLGRIRYLRPFFNRKRVLILSVEESLFDFYHRRPKAFRASLLLNFAYHGAAIIEVFLIVWLMGTKLTLFGALAIEALTKLVNIAGTFNPGNIGTYEGGNMLITKMFGFTATAGLTLAFARRLRSLFWSGVGMFCLIGLSNRSKTEKRSRTNEDIMQVTPEQISSEERPSTSASQRRPSHLAVLLANNPGLGFPLSQVGSLPILLRSILGAAKAGAARIVVVIDRAKGPRIRQELLKTGRVPCNVEWCGWVSGEGSLPALIGQLASEIDGHLVLIAGDRVYHSSLQKRAAEWDGGADALTLMTGSDAVGICSLSRQASIDLAIHNPTTAASVEDIDYCLTKTHDVESEAVADEQWQRVLNEQQRLGAERKLDRWLVKPTDGIFARMNRKISIPISRIIIPLPITPNMVSLFTLGVSFAAGAFFALGGYWNMFTGALLSWFSSVLDGCDGEVARLKLQESAFGCWLETVCDNLYYLFIFSGLTIGLVRSSGNRSYLVWGGLLLLGVIASAFMTGLQRHQLTSEPERYLLEWHKRADSRSSNPLLYLGRHTEFIIRRCFLPYVILFFSLFGVMNWLLIGATVGANMVWIIALYSYLSFSQTRATALQSPVV